MQNAYVVLCLAFIFCPIVTLIVFSFNVDRFPSLPWRGFSLAWYDAVFEDSTIVDAFKNTLLVGVGTAIVSTLLGFTAAYFDFRWNFRLKQLYLAIVVLPPTIPFLILGACLSVVSRLRMKGIDKTSRQTRVRRWLERVGIAEFAHRNVADLSGGQKQRVALARSLVTEPSILLLDEPVGSLDAHLRVLMQSELKALQKELGITFVYVTHNQSEAFAMANKVVIMKDGKVQQVGSPQEVYRAPQNRFVAEFVGTNNLLSGVASEVTSDRVTVKTKVGDFTARTGTRKYAPNDRVTIVGIQELSPGCHGWLTPDPRLSEGGSALGVFL
jgi:ABC-type dipeptide/oligopeptide/nickel transport system ATPase subunit